MGALGDRVARLESRTEADAASRIGVVTINAGASEADALALWCAQNPEQREPGLLVIVSRFGGEQ